MTFDLVIIDALEPALLPGGDIADLPTDEILPLVKNSGQIISLNALIARYPKPHIAFCARFADGRRRGDFRHGSHRIVGESVK